MIEHELPEGWEIKQLKELCDLFNGAAFKSTDYVETVTDTLLIRMGNIRPNAKFDPLYKVTFLPNEYATQFANYILRDGDLIIAMTDMATETKILGIPTAVHVPKGKTLLLNQRVGKLIIKTPNELDCRYIQLYLTSTYANNHYKNLGKGGVQINLGKSDILSVSVILPKINQQKQIVAKIEQLFGELDDSVNILQALKQQVKVFRQSILKAAFNGKLTGSYVSDNALPAGWKTNTINDLPLKIIDGDRGKNYPKQSDFTTSGHCVFLNIKNVTTSGFDFTNVMFITESKDNQLRNGKLNRGDIVLTTRGTLGNTAYYGDIVDYHNLRINSGMVIIRVDSNQINQNFLCYFIKSVYFSEQVNKFKTGSAQPQLPINILNRFVVIIPNTIEEQNQIVTKIEKLFATCDELDQTIDNALNQSQLLRQSILKQAFSGKLI